MRGSRHAIGPRLPRSPGDSAQSSAPIHAPKVIVMIPCSNGAHGETVESHTDCNHHHDAVSENLGGDGRLQIGADWICNHEHALWNQVLKQGLLVSPRKRVSLTANPSQQRNIQRSSWEQRSLALGSILIGRHSEHQLALSHCAS
jgi:hypothetical protein